MAAQVEQPIVYIGALDPEALGVVITATKSLPDLTVVTASVDVTRNRRLWSLRYPRNPPTLF